MSVFFFFHINTVIACLCLFVYFYFCRGVSVCVSAAYPLLVLLHIGIVGSRFILTSPSVRVVLVGLLVDGRGLVGGRKKDGNGCQFP